MAHISVIIPVYNGESCLRELLRRLKKSLEDITNDFEVLFIEDCGNDSSWSVIEQMAKDDARIKGYKFSRNFGQQYGITAGTDHCNGDWVVVMDCDLQDQPEEIPKLYKKALEGFDVVLARRANRRDNLQKRLFSWTFYVVFRYLSGIPYNGEVGNFRIVSRKVIEKLRLMREQLRFFGGLVTWLGFATASIEVEHATRYSGKTTYTYRKLFKLAAESIIAYSDKPLWLSVKFGFVIAAGSFLYGVNILLRALLYNSPVLGWASLIISLYFFSGVIISILGVIGIYLGKTFDECKKRPLYVVSRVTSNGKGFVAQ